MKNVITVKYKSLLKKLNKNGFFYQISETEKFNTILCRKGLYQAKLEIPKTNPTTTTWDVFGDFHQGAKVKGFNSVIEVMNEASKTLNQNYYKTKLN